MLLNRLQYKFYNSDIIKLYLHILYKRIKLSQSTSIIHYRNPGQKKTCSYKQDFKIWHRLTLPRVTAVPSALVGLTSLFGMGRGGHHRYRHLNILILNTKST